MLILCRWKFQSNSGLQPLVPKKQLEAYINYKMFSLLAQVYYCLALLT